MSDVAIIGFGVLGQQLLNFLQERGSASSYIIFDDIQYRTAEGNNVFPFDQYLQPEFQDCKFYVALGYKHLPVRKKIIATLQQAGRELPSFIHHTCYISPLSKVADGSLFFPLCNVDQNVAIGMGNIFHNSVTISHDTLIGDCNYFSPSVTVAGNVSIGEKNFFGAASVVSNNVSIGDEVIIGVGSCVNKDIGTGNSVIGNPQRTLTKRLSLQ